MITRRFNGGRRQRGAAMMEYTCGILVFASLLAFVPVPKAMGGDGTRSATEMLVEAMKENYDGYSWGMAVPI